MAEVEVKQPRITADMVAEARVAQIIQEEEQETSRNEDIKKLQEETSALFTEMWKARDNEDEDERRKIRNEIVVKNLRLVTTVLQKYGYFSQDKFQNGCIGLLKAAETYNMDVVGSRGTAVPFKNYACFCIEMEIRMAYARHNRKFEGKNARFLDSLDAPATTHDGEEMDKHTMIEDYSAAGAFDELLEQVDMRIIYYDIIIPAIDEYATRAKELNLQRWKELTLRYIVELSLEHSRRQRLTFTEMAKEVGSTPQNLRNRHKKVMEVIRKRCMQFGYYLDTSGGRARVSWRDPLVMVDSVKKPKAGRRKGK